MKTIRVKDLMVPLSDYKTIGEDATLSEAVMALEKAQIECGWRICPHRSLLVLDAEGKVRGEISQWDILRALEPKYNEMGDPLAMSRAGFSPQFLKSMLQQYALWDQPLKDICNKGARLKVARFMRTVVQGEYVEEDATLDEAMHQLVMGRHHSLLVTRDGEITGILMLADVFMEIHQMMKACEL